MDSSVSCVCIIVGFGLWGVSKGEHHENQQREGWPIVLPFLTIKESFFRNPKNLMADYPMKYI